MRDSVLGLDSTSAPMSGGHEQEEFCFAFNDSKFSDRVLRIEIVSDHPETRPEPEGCQTLDDCTARKSKRRRGDILTRDDAAANSGESNCSEDCLRVLRVKTLHISSPILAAKSPFFYKLFSNGMMESEQKQVTLRINDSEEPVFMELLNFMYSNTFTSNTEPALLDLLMAADKFEVTSCMKRCICSLKDLPMTVESALRYLDLPFSVLMVDEVQHLTDAAKQFLVVQYKDISKCQDEVMNMPLVGIEAILSSDDLQVDSEDAVYKFALRWTKANYQKPEERREILSTRLGQCIRFPYMSCRKLKKILSCNDFDHEFATKSVLDALFFKAEGPLGQRSHAIEESTSTSRCFVERAYTCRPVKIVEFKLPHQKCVVYLDLKREQCANLFPCRRVCSQAFHFAGKRFFLSAECNGDHRGSCHFFGLYLWMQEKGSGTFCVEYEFSARSKPTEKYVRKDKGIYTFTEGKGRGSRNLFWDTWTSFMAEDSVYFINGVLDLQVELTIKQGFKL